MGRKINYTVGEEFDGKKVISFLRSEAGISARLLKTLKRTENGITLNSQHIRTIDPIHTGDILSIDIPCPDSEIEPTDMALDIIYEDDDLVVINKSPFLACHPTHNHQGDTLANALTAHLIKNGKPTVFRAVGRLDKGTSGIVICALNKHCAARLQKNVQKEYLAIAHGKLAESGTIDKPIYRPDPMKTLRAVGEGDNAVTHWRVIKQDGQSALVRIRLETGRTHQIRVHFASEGHPLVGDSMYGSDPNGYGHQMLHCAAVSFHHPVTNEEIQLNAPMPPDMQAVADGIE